MAHASSDLSPDASADQARVAIVTGGARGIGRAISEALLDRGWIVELCAHSQSSVDQVLAALRPEHGDRVGARIIDVGRQDEVDAFVDSVLDRRGRIDCVINNAGIGHMAPVDDIEGDDWRRLIDTNLNGPFYFTRAVAPSMRLRGDGWIIHLGSLASRHAFAGGSAYNASKFGLLGLSQASMLDLRDAGIRVAAILPGSVDTEFHDSAGDDWNPTGRDSMLRPEDVAQAVVDVLAYPKRALPSVVELGPAHPG